MKGFRVSVSPVYGCLLGVILYTPDPDLQDVYADENENEIMFCFLWFTNPHKNAMRGEMFQRYFFSCDHFHFIKII